MIILILAHFCSTWPCLEAFEHVECVESAQVLSNTCNMHNFGYTTWIGVM